MIEKAPETPVKKNPDLNDHLANERTFLAWIRTTLGIIAFGFVVERFTYVMKQMASILGKSTLPPAFEDSSSFFGICLVGVGSVLSLFVLLKYKKTQKQIHDGTYRSSLILNTLLAFFIFFIGVLLIISFIFPKSG